MDLFYLLNLLEIEGVQEGKLKSPTPSVGALMLSTSGHVILLFAGEYVAPLLFPSQKTRKW